MKEGAAEGLVGPLEVNPPPHTHTGRRPLHLPLPSVLWVAPTGLNRSEPARGAGGQGGRPAAPLSPGGARRDLPTWPCLSGVPSPSARPRRRDFPLGSGYIPFTANNLKA